MKKSMLVTMGLILIIALLAVGCTAPVGNTDTVKPAPVEPVPDVPTTPIPTEPTPAEPIPVPPIGVRGEVKDIVQGKDGITFTVEGKKQLDTRFDIATITVTKDTVLENIAAYSDLKEGYIVEVICPDITTMTYPVMSGADKLTVLSTNEISIRGTVKELVQGKDGITFLVDGIKEADTQYDKGVVTVNMKTVVQNAESFGEIKEGTKVEVKLTGPILESYPLQGVASAVKVLK